jgi:hypothetical protein
MSLTGGEFVRRFLQHILPKGLMRVRDYGFLANRSRRKKRKQIRQSLKVSVTERWSEPTNLAVWNHPFPRCKKDTLQKIAEFLPQQPRWVPPG